MTPHQGSGAGQAIEDAWILASILSNPLVTKETLPEALKVYDEVRRPFANEIVRKSAASGRLYEFNEPESIIVEDFGKTEKVGESDAGLLWNVGHSVCDRWKWAWTTTIDGDQERAAKLLASRLAH